jgi:putative sterol carrier protein
MEVTELLAQMPGRFDKDAADGLDTVFQFKVEEANNFHLVVKDKSLVISDGDHQEPEVTLSMDEETFVGMMTGETDGMQAFMSGKLTAEGNIMLASKLQTLFPN